MNEAELTFNDNFDVDGERLSDWLGSIWCMGGGSYMLIVVHGGFSLLDLELGSLLRDPSRDFSEVVKGANLFSKKVLITIKELK